MSEPGPDRPPSVDRLARSLRDTGLPHPLLVDAARRAIDAGNPDSAANEARALATSMLQPVINATGVLLHTNLGRAPLGHDQSARYANLEVDLSTGRRGSRSAHAATLLARATGAEAGLVVNNGAAAVLLVLAALARGRGAAVSRGELVEIGGGFRVPDVMEESGAVLIEVGTTNRTRIDDYARAVGDNDVALALKVHQSNYRIVGFTEEVTIAEMAGLGVPVVADLGSGLVDAACPWLADGPPAWLDGEPAVKQSLAAGADVVIFSGDKLLGGPQAGVIVGSAELVDRCARHPLARALRPGGLVLSALQEVALAYLDRRADQLPFWAMATRSRDELAERAERFADLESVEVVATASVPGGGTLPGVEIPSVGLAVNGDVSAALRDAVVPVVARVADGRTVCDLRTVAPEEDEALHQALQDARAGAPRATTP